MQQVRSLQTALDQAAVPMIQDDRCANDLQGRGPFRNNGTLPLSSTLENYGGSLNLAFDIGDTLVLKSISAYRDIRWTGVRDADNTPLTILHTLYDVQADQLSQELQLTYQSEALTGVVGLYYFEQTSEDIVTVELNTPAPGCRLSRWIAAGTARECRPRYPRRPVSRYHDLPPSEGVYRVETNARIVRHGASRPLREC